MNTLLVINSSGRRTRSITRALTARFAQGWRAQHPGAEIITRETGMAPVPPVDEAWIAAAFTPAESRTPAMHRTLALSEALIEEIMRADAVVIGAPMYNFGMPAQLKAWIDQVVRVGRTFSLHPDTPEPYRPLVPSKPVIIITSTGDGGFEPGGPLAHMNHLEPHLKTALGFIGLEDVSFIRAGFEEHQNGAFRRSLEAAERAADEAVERLSSTSIPA